MSRRELARYTGEGVRQTNSFSWVSVRPCSAGKIRKEVVLSAQASLAVLLVGDDETHRKMLSQVLRVEGFAVTAVSTGAEGLRRAREAPDLILLDVQLPDLSGFEVCRRLRANSATAPIPILLLSGRWVGSEDRINGLEAGANLYLLQSMEPRELIAHVRALVRTHQAEPALWESENRYRLLVEAVEDYAILMLDPQGHVLTWNRGAERLKGYRSEEIIGQHFSRFYTPEDRAAGKPGQVLEAVRVEGRVVEEGWRLRQDGSRFWARVILTALRDSCGSLQGYGGVTEDLTERKRAEEKLHLTQFAFDNSATPTFWIGPDGRFLSVNEAACRLLGYSGEELLRLRVQDINPNYPGEEWDSHWRRLRESRSLVIETTVSRKHGGTTWLEIHANYLIYEGREYNCAFGLDITQRKQAERQLHFQASLLDQVRNAVIATDLEGKVISWNRFAETLYQWKQEEVLGKSLQDFIVPEASRDLGGPILRTVRERGHWEGEFPVRRKDGLVFPVHVIDVALTDRQGSLYGYVGVSEDISERKRSEEALRDRETRLRLLLEQMPAVVWTTDRELRIVTSHGAGLSGVPDQDQKPTGKTVVDLFGSDPRHPALQAYQKALLGEGVAFEGEWGGRCWQAYLEPLRPPQGAILGTLGVALDITERKKAEAEKERLYQEVVAGRELLGILSRRLIETQEAERRHLAHELHDEIGQVLTTVHLSLETLRAGVGPTGLPRLEEAVQVVKGAIEQVRGLSLDLRPPALDLLGLEAALRAYLKRQATQAGLRAELDSALGGERLPAALESVCFRVVQEALTNTLRHARAHRFWVELVQPEEGGLHLTIRDDGQGFDVAAAQRGLREGRGFGLLSMQERVHLFGGRIDIASTPGRGTTIAVQFPLPETGPTTSEEES